MGQSEIVGHSGHCESRVVYSKVLVEDVIVGLKVGQSGTVGQVGSSGQVISGQLGAVVDRTSRVGQGSQVGG